MSAAQIGVEQSRALGALLRWGSGWVWGLACFPPKETISPGMQMKLIHFAGLVIDAFPVDTPRGEVYY